VRYREIISPDHKNTNCFGKLDFAQSEDLTSMLKAQDFWDTAVLRQLVNSNILQGLGVFTFIS